MNLMAQKTRMCGFSAAPKGPKAGAKFHTARFPPTHTAEPRCAAGEQAMLPGNSAPQ
jgi:hypothetical protein